VCVCVCVLCVYDAKIDHIEFFFTYFLKLKLKKLDIEIQKKREYKKLYKLKVFVQRR